jgi:hypothetical protein
LTGEYELARREFGFTDAEIEEFVNNSFLYAFDGEKPRRKANQD